MLFLDCAFENWAEQFLKWSVLYLGQKQPRSR
jgi:hypothetical protein